MNTKQMEEQAREITNAQAARLISDELQPIGDSNDQDLEARGIFDVG